MLAKTPKRVILFRMKFTEYFSEKSKCLSNAYLVQLTETNFSLLNFVKSKIFNKFHSYTEHIV